MTTKTASLMTAYIAMTELHLRGLESDAKNRCDQLQEQAKGPGADDKWYYLFSIYARLLRRDPKEAETLYQKIFPTIGTSLVDALLLNVHARVLLSRDDPHSWDAATAELRKALEVCPAKPPRIRWSLLHNLGLAEMRLQRYERAERAYGEAIHCGGKAAYCSLTHSNLGVMQFGLGKYDKAKSCFEEARRLDKRDLYGFDENNLAFLNLFLALEWRDFITQQNAAAAIVSARAMLATCKQMHPQDPTAAYNFGLLQWLDDNPTDAARSFSESWSLHIANSSSGADALAGSLTALLMQRIAERESQYALGNMPADDAALEPVELGRAQAARAFIRNVSNDADLFIPSLLQALSFKTERLTRDRTIGSTPNQDQLAVLRRWNSYTPLVQGPDQRRGRGGGYFVSWRGTGLVIDPGQDFIDNFLTAGFSLADIDAILVTHAHLDHILDLDPLLTLLHERNTRLGAPTAPVNLYLNVGSSMKELSWLANLPATTVSSITILYPDRTVAVSEGVTVETTRAFHDEIVSKMYCIGLKLRLHDALRDIWHCVGITSDTRWDAALRDQYSDCSVLVAHVGSVGFGEVAAVARLGIAQTEYVRLVEQGGENGAEKPVLDANVANALGYEDLAGFNRFLVRMDFDVDDVRRTQHLGFTGIYDIAREFTGSLLVLSEFGEELGCFRAQIARALRSSGAGRQDIRVLAPVLTGDVGLRVSLPGAGVRCGVCGKFVDVTRIREKCLPWRGMFYYCEAHSAEELGAHSGFSM
jgi:tetratricopeptide (TPR) repeat protein